MTLLLHQTEHFKTAPRAVLFDLDNTLYAYDPAHARAVAAVVQQVTQSLGIKPEAFTEAWQQARQNVHQRLKGTAASHSRLLYFQETLELLKLRGRLQLALELEQTYWRTFMAAAVIFEGAREFLADLRRHDIRTAIVSDLTTQIQFRKLVYWNLDELFDHVITSEEVGAEKPDPMPFRRALEKLALEPGQVVMIGDNPETDMAGAHAMGISTFQKRHAGVKAEKADAVFDDYADLGRFWRERGWLGHSLAGAKHAA